MSGVDWLTDAGAAFALSRSSARPLFLYWGASWCPPCNRIKATVFADPDFARMAPAFIALHIDGDSAGAQALAQRLHLRSYPTLVLYRPDGGEITRLPCELPCAAFLALLRTALASPVTARALLATALEGQRGLSADEWRILSDYSWDTDEGRLLGDTGLGDIAARLGHRFTPPAPLTDRAALVRIEEDADIVIVDRLAALRTRIRLERGGFTGLARARQLIDAALASVQEPAMRHQLVNTAAGILADAGALDAAGQLLRDELPRSHSPFYFMHNLAAVAQKRGDRAGALDWYERAWLEARGPATRLQWGATCLLAVLDATPADGERIERIAAGLCSHLATMADAAMQRNGSQCERMAAALARAGLAEPHASALKRALSH